MNKKGEFGRLIFWTVLAILLGLLICYLFLPLMGVSPSLAFTTMVTGVFSDKFTMGNILIKTTPLILTGLAFSFTYKANLYNIGAQGQFYMGCMFAVAVSLKLGEKIPGPLALILACAAAMAGGALTGFIIGFLKAKTGANEFLVSMMSTYVVIYLLQYSLGSWLQEDKHEYLKTNSIKKSAWLPKIIDGTSVSLGIVIAVIAAIVVWLILYRTTLGYRVRVTGQNINAARLSGINPYKEYMIAFAISGAIAGLAGFTEINGMQHMLLTDFESSIGSYGIGIAIMASANPIGVIFAALLFGFLQVGGTVLSHSTDAPASVIDLMLGFVMLFVLMSFFFRRKAEIRAMKKQALAKEES